MTPETALAKVPAITPISKPTVTSFDSGYEHSLEHMLEVRRIVDEADADRVSVQEWFKATA
jgi:hypothetical protein